MLRSARWSYLAFGYRDGRRCLARGWGAEMDVWGFPPWSGSRRVSVRAPKEASSMRDSLERGDETIQRPRNWTNDRTADGMVDDGLVESRGAFVLLDARLRPSNWKRGRALWLRGRCVRRAKSGDGDVAGHGRGCRGPATHDETTGECQGRMGVRWRHGTDGDFILRVGSASIFFSKSERDRVVHPRR